MVKGKHPAREAGPKQGTAEKRSAPRLPPSAITDLKSVRLIAGPEVTLINISRGGALIETDALLVPHSSIAIRLVTAEAVFLLRGRVLRSRASSFHGSNLVYHSALAFDEELPFLDGIQEQPKAETESEEALLQAVERETFDPGMQPKAETVPEKTFLQAGEGVAVDPGMQPENAEKPAMITIDIPLPPWGPDLRQIFGFNNW